MPLFTSEYVFSDDYPTIEPSLKLDFANARALDPRITFERASTATYVGRDGLIKTAGEDEARFDHDPATGESLGLLIEESRTNLTKYSNTLQTFQPVNGTITTNQTTSPSGENNASLLTQTAASTCYVNYGSGQITWTSGQKYTFSCFVKKYSDSDENQIYILGYGLTFNSDPSGANSVVRFNLDTLTSTTADGLVNSHSIDDVGNGWRRISATFTAYTTESRSHQVLRFVDPGATSNMYVWGYQIEEGAFPTSYIPTSESTVTRSKDVPVISGTSFSDFYNSSEGSIAVRYNMDGYYGVDGYNRVFEISDGTPSNRFTPLLNQTQQLLYEAVSIAGTNELIYDTTPISFGPFYTWVAGYKQNDFQRYSIDVNGNIDSISDSSLNINNLSVNQLNLGHQGDSAIRQLCGHIKYFYYYPKRLTNTQLQTLTQ